MRASYSDLVLSCKFSRSGDFSKGLIVTIEVDTPNVTPVIRRKTDECSPAINSHTILVMFNTVLNSFALLIYAIFFFDKEKVYYCQYQA